MGQAQPTNSSGNTTIAQNDNTTTAAATVEFNQENLEQRHKAASAAVLALPQVQSVISSAYNYAIDFHWLENKDIVVISTWGSQDVEGNWTTGYTINLKGGKIIQVDVDRATNAASNVAINSRPDQSVPLNFTDNQKRAIEISLTDPQVKEFAANNPFYVSLVRDYGNIQFRDKDCGVDECAIVQFTSLTGKGGAGTIVNTETGAIHDVRVVTG